VDITSTTATTIAIGNQSGDVTHHQLQSIVSVSFKTRNIRNNVILIPIPPDVFFSLISFFFIYSIYESSFAKTIPSFKKTYPALAG
jgi:hypothetical protein